MSEQLDKPEKEKPIAPGNHEKAWNDPPLFSVGFNTQGGGPRANKLTARVAFPLNNGTPSSTTSSPPPDNSNVQTSPPIMPPGMRSKHIPPGETLTPNNFAEHLLNAVKNTLAREREDQPSEMSSAINVMSPPPLLVPPPSPASPFVSELSNNIATTTNHSPTSTSQ